MFKSEFDQSNAFVPLSIAVLAVSDTRTLETDTGGALLKSLLSRDSSAGGGAGAVALLGAKRFYFGVGGR